MATAIEEREVANESGRQGPQQSLPPASLTPEMVSRIVKALVAGVNQFEVKHDPDVWDYVEKFEKDIAEHRRAAVRCLGHLVDCLDEIIQATGNEVVFPHGMIHMLESICNELGHRVGMLDSIYCTHHVGDSFSRYVADKADRDIENVQKELLSLLPS